MKVESFKGEFEFLSNFYPCEIRIEGMVYPTVEHAFQAMKTTDPTDRRKIQAAKTPGAAKSLGKKVLLKHDWDAIRVEVMHKLLLKKFANEDLANKLLASDGLELIEGNTWGDTFWGVCKGKGQNNLGQLLMLVREQIKAERGL